MSAPGPGMSLPNSALTRRLPPYMQINLKTNESTMRPPRPPPPQSTSKGRGEGSGGRGARSAQSVAT